MRLKNLVQILSILIRKSTNTFTIKSPQGGVNLLMASRYLESFADFISEDETLLNGSKGFQIFVGNIDGRHVEALSHAEALIGITNRKIIIVYDKNAIAPKIIQLDEIREYTIKDCEGNPFLIKDLVFITQDGSVTCYRGGELFSLEVKKLFEELKVLPKPI